MAFNFGFAPATAPAAPPVPGFTIGNFTAPGAFQAPAPGAAGATVGNIAQGGGGGGALTAAGGPAAATTAVPAATVPLGITKEQFGEQDLIITQFFNALPRKASRALAEKGARKVLTAIQQALEMVRKSDGVEESDGRLQGYVFRFVVHNISPDTPEVRKYPTLKNMAITEAEWVEALKYQELPHREGLPAMPLVPLVLEGFTGLKQRVEQHDGALGRLADRARICKKLVEDTRRATAAQGERRQHAQKQLLALRKRVLEVSARVDSVLSDPRFHLTTSLVTERAAEAALAHRLRAAQHRFVEPACVQTRLSECADRAMALRAAEEAALARSNSMRGGYYAQAAQAVRPEVLEQAMVALRELHHGIAELWTRVDEGKADLDIGRRALENLRRCGCARNEGGGGGGDGGRAGGGGGGGGFFVAGTAGW